MGCIRSAPVKSEDELEERCVNGFRAEPIGDGKYIINYAEPEHSTACEAASAKQREHHRRQKQPESVGRSLEAAQRPDNAYPATSHEEAQSAAQRDDSPASSIDIPLRQLGEASPALYGAPRAVSSTGPAARPSSNPLSQQNIRPGESTSTQRRPPPLSDITSSDTAGCRPSVASKTLEGIDGRESRANALPAQARSSASAGNEYIRVGQVFSSFVELYDEVLRCDSKTPEEIRRADYGQKKYIKCLHHVRAAGRPSATRLGKSRFLILATLL